MFLRMSWKGALFPEVYFAGVGDGIALAGLDVDGRVSVIEDLDGVVIGVFFVLQFNVDHTFSLRLLSLLIAADALGEIKPLTATIGHIVGASEIGKVGDEGVVAYFDGVAVRDVFGTAPHWIHAVDTNLILSLRQCSLDLGGFFCCPRCTLFGNGTSAQHHQCRAREKQCCQECLHITGVWR